jgi:hypothetical protein
MPAMFRAAFLMLFSFRDSPPIRTVRRARGEGHPVMLLAEIARTDGRKRVLRKLMVAG